MRNNQKDQDMLKVLKMNQEQCEQALAQARMLNDQASEQIAATDDFIARFDNITGYHHLTHKSQTPMVAIPASNQITIPNWPDLVAEANRAHPEEVTYEDLLTPA